MEAHYQENQINRVNNMKCPIIILIGYISTCSYLLQNIDPVIMRVCLNPKLKKNVR